MIEAAAILALAAVLWRLAAHLTAAPTLERAYECRCGRAYRSDHALAQHVAAMHPAAFDGAQVFALRGAIRVEVVE